MSQTYVDERIRVTEVQSNKKSDMNWLFLPGGPGMDASYLLDLTQKIEIWGNVYHVDLPGNGSNKECFKTLSAWHEDLVEMVKAFSNVVLIGHSFGGMLILTTPGLEEYLKGLVLIATSPSLFTEVVKDYGIKYQLPNIEEAFFKYLSHPSDRALKNYFTDTFKPYALAQKYYQYGENLFEKTEFNHKVFDDCAMNFYPTYAAKWVPKELPTLIVAGEKDYFTPPDLFKRDERFKRKNVQLVEVAEGGHYPWVENFTVVNEVLCKFESRLLSASL